jgi:hypothetical protein
MREDFGFENHKGNSLTRMMKPTPYAAANKLPTENSYVSYWTFEGSKVSKVQPAGALYAVNHTSQLAVVPTLSVDVEALELDGGSGTLEDPYTNSRAALSLWLRQNMFFDFKNCPEMTLVTKYDVAETYTGPGVNYYRSHRSQIGAGRLSVRVLAKEADWFMVEYKAGFGSEKKRLKTAWIHRSEIGSLHMWHLNGLATMPEFNIPGTMAQQADLHDDLDRMREPLYTLWEGQQIEFLGYTLVSGVSYAYVETTIFDQPARGFVPLESILLDEYEIEKILNMIGD